MASHVVQNRPARLPSPFQPNLPAFSAAGSNTHPSEQSGLAAMFEKAISRIKESTPVWAQRADEYPLDPEINVSGIGPILLPLQADQAEALRRACEKSSFWRGSAKVLDNHVRDSWQLHPKGFQIGNTLWSQHVAQTFEGLKTEIGLAGINVKIVLNKLLLYEPGSHFIKQHRNVATARNAIAKLIVTLPSSHKGGDVHIRYKDWGTTLPSFPDQQTFTAWYSDIVHSLKRVDCGYRLDLSYDVIRDDFVEINLPAPIDEDMAALRKVAKSWIQTKDDLSIAPELVWVLTHYYTAKDISLNLLKHRDLRIAVVLRQLCAEFDIAMFLAPIGIQYKRTSSGRRRARQIGKTTLNKIIDIAGWSKEVSSVPKTCQKSIVQHNFYHKEWRIRHTKNIVADANQRPYNLYEEFGIVIMQQRRLPEFVLRIDPAVLFSGSRNENMSFLEMVDYNTDSVFEYYVQQMQSTRGDPDAGQMLGHICRYILRLTVPMLLKTSSDLTQDQARQQVCQQVKTMLQYRLSLFRMLDNRDLDLMVVDRIGHFSFPLKAGIIVVKDIMLRRGWLAMKHHFRRAVMASVNLSNATIILRLLCCRPDSMTLDLDPESPKLRGFVTFGDSMVVAALHKMTIVTSPAVTEMIDNFRFWPSSKPLESLVEKARVENDPGIMLNVLVKILGVDELSAPRVPAIDSIFNALFPQLVDTLTRKSDLFTSCTRSIFDALAEIVAYVYEKLEGHADNATRILNVLRSQVERATPTLFEEKMIPFLKILNVPSASIRKYVNMETFATPMISRYMRLRSGPKPQLPNPATWHRWINFKSDCSDCEMVLKFLEDGSRSQMRFSESDTRRQHLERRLHRFAGTIGLATETLHGAAPVLLVTKTLIMEGQEKLNRWKANEDLVYERLGDLEAFVGVEEGENPCKSDSKSLVARLGHVKLGDMLSHYDLNDFTASSEHDIGLPARLPRRETAEIDPVRASGSTRLADRMPSENSSHEFSRIQGDFDIPKDQAPRPMRSDFQKIFTDDPRRIALSSSNSRRGLEVLDENRIEAVERNLNLTTSPRVVVEVRQRPHHRLLPHSFMQEQVADSTRQPSPQEFFDVPETESESEGPISEYEEPIPRRRRRNTSRMQALVPRSTPREHNHIATPCLGTPSPVESTPAPRRTSSPVLTESPLRTTLCTPASAVDDEKVAIGLFHEMVFERYELDLQRSRRPEDNLSTSSGPMVASSQPKPAKKVAMHSGSRLDVPTAPSQETSNFQSTRVVYVPQIVYLPASAAEERRKVRTPTTVRSLEESSKRGSMTEPFKRSSSKRRRQDTSVLSDSELEFGGRNAASSPIPPKDRLEVSDTRRAVSHGSGHKRARLEQSSTATSPPSLDERTMADPRAKNGAKNREEIFRRSSAPSTSPARASGKRPTVVIVLDDDDESD